MTLWRRWRRSLELAEESFTILYKKHISRSLERHVRATRDHTWRVLLKQIEATAGPYVVEGSPPPHGEGAVLHLMLDPSKPPLVETVLSFEPPWRRAYKIEGDTGLDMYHGTFAIRDDGPECHLIWGVVVDPEPSAEGLEFLELAISVIAGFLDRVVSVAEGGADERDH